MKCNYRFVGTRGSAAASKDSLGQADIAEAGKGTSGRLRQKEEVSRKKKYKVSL
jgi:hypothetical protein